MSLVTKHLGTTFDRKAQAAGINFRQLRYGQNALIVPNPIVLHLGVQTQDENVNPLSPPEPFNTFVAKIPKDGLATTLQNYGLTVAEAIAPNALWYVSHDNGATWTSLRNLGDCTRISPARYHLTLVEMGV